MESERFDRIARALRTSSRRRVLAGLAVTFLATLGPRRGSAACQDGTVQEGPCGTRECIEGEFVDFFEDAGTVCREAADDCDQEEVCSGSSIACPIDRKRANGATCSSDDNPCTRDICSSGTCTHPALQDGTTCPGGSCCGGQCLDTGGDEANCGGCGVSCETGETCCGGACVNLLTDRQNCGLCGKRCRKGNCRNGRCKKRKKKKH
jgi:hypothetical protein